MQQYDICKKTWWKIDGRDNILSGAADINVGESYVFALKDYGNGDYGFVNTTQSAMALKNLLYMNMAASTERMCLL